MSKGKGVRVVGLVIKIVQLYQEKPRKAKNSQEERPGPVPSSSDVCTMSLNTPYTERKRNKIASTKTKQSYYTKLKNIIITYKRLYMLQYKTYMNKVYIKWDIIMNSINYKI